MKLPAAIVTGANGFVGGSIVRALRSQGSDVVSLVRRGRSVDGGGPVATLDDWTEDLLAKAFAGREAVVHAASVVHRPDAPPDEYRRFNIDGTRMLLNAARTAGVRRVVFISTIKVYGDDLRSVINEDSPTAGEGGYAGTKLVAERLVLSDAAGLSGIVLRLAPVFGPGDKGNIRTMIRAIARRRFALPGDGSNRKSIVHISTVTDVVAAALASDVQGTFIVADSSAPSMRELSDTIARELSRARPLSIPTPLLNVAAGAAEVIFGALGKRPPVTRDLIRKSLSPSVCSPARVEAALQLSCHVDLSTAIREEVAWMRAEKLL